MAGIFLRSLLRRLSRTVRVPSSSSVRWFPSRANRRRLGGRLTRLQLEILVRLLLERISSTTELVPIAWVQFLGRSCHHRKG